MNHLLIGERSVALPQGTETAPAQIRRGRRDQTVSPTNIFSQIQPPDRVLSNQKPLVTLCHQFSLSHRTGGLSGSLFRFRWELVISRSSVNYFWAIGFYFRAMGQGSA